MTDCLSPAFGMAPTRTLGTRLVRWETVGAGVHWNQTLPQNLLQLPPVDMQANPILLPPLLQS
jgi:hypothetical protein